MVSTMSFVVCASLCVAGSLAIEWKHLKLTSGRNHDIPLTLEGLIESQNYSLMVQDKDLFLDFYAFKNDPRVAIGVDSWGNIGGVRVSYIKSDLTTRGDAKNLTFPAFYENKPYFSSGTFLDTEVYYNDVLFVHPSVLKAGGRQDTGGLLGEYVYLNLNGAWTALPKYECNATSQGFTLQACYPTMGLHYFYEMRNDTVCTDLQPAFVYYENGEMIGIGVTALGARTVTEDRAWLEDVPKDILSTIIPNRPDCLLPWVDDYGITTLHFFFKEDPDSTPCAESVC